MVQEVISGRQQSGLKQGNEGKEITLEYFGSILVPGVPVLGLQPCYTDITTVLYSLAFWGKII